MKDKIYQFQIANLNKQIEKSKVIITDFFKMVEKPYIALSWGKDSTVMTHLIISINDNIDVISFVNEKDFHIETIINPIRDQYLNKFNINNYIEISDIPIIERYKKFGIPTIEVSTSEYEKQSAPACNKIVNCIIKNNNYDGCFLGLRIEESRIRKMNYSKRGHTYYNKSKTIKICNPLNYWTNEDIWTYIKLNNIPYQCVYDEDMIFNKKDIRSEHLYLNKENIGQLVNYKLYHKEIYNKLIEELDL